MFNHLFLFQPNEHNTLNTCIHHQLPCSYFGVCYTIFRETITLFTKKLYDFCNVAITCTICPFLNLQYCYNVQHVCISSYCILKILKIPSCSILISVTALNFFFKKSLYCTLYSNIAKHKFFEQVHNGLPDDGVTNTETCRR
jgi:hypothetical protein